MNNLYKLKEICEKYGISRRVVQGYEKKGLINPTDKNDSGHLLYDEETVKKIIIIRFLNNFSSLEEIKPNLLYGRKKLKKLIDYDANQLRQDIKTNKAYLEWLSQISELDFSNPNLTDKIYQIITEGKEINNEKNI